MAREHGIAEFRPAPLEQRSARRRDSRSHAPDRRESCRARPAAALPAAQRDPLRARTTRRRCASARSGRRCLPRRGCSRWRRRALALDASANPAIRSAADSTAMRDRLRGSRLASARAPSFRLTIRTRATSAAPAAASSAKVAAPGSRIAAATRSTKIDATVTPGTRPITVPSRKSRQRMCDAPATMLTTENGPTGTTRANMIASRPRSPRRRDRSFSRRPASPRTVCRLRCRPMANVSRAAQRGADQRVGAAEHRTEDDAVTPTSTVTGNSTRPPPTKARIAYSGASGLSRSDVTELDQPGRLEPLAQRRVAPCEGHCRQRHDDERDEIESRPRAAARFFARHEIGDDGVGVDRPLGIEHLLVRHQRVEAADRAPARSPSSLAGRRG